MYLTNFKSGVFVQNFKNTIILNSIALLQHYNTVYQALHVTTYIGSHYFEFTSL